MSDIDVRRNSNNSDDTSEISKTYNNNKNNNNNNNNCNNNNDKRTYRNSSFTENLCLNLNRLRKEKKFCDWTLKTEDGYELSVHKNVLASTSSYFEGLLNSGMLECSQDYLIVKKISGKCLELIIEYIYTGEICINEQTVQEILENAMYFGLISLIDICSEFLSEYITSENSLQLWRYSETFSSNILKKKCIEHILENGEDIFKTSSKSLQLSSSSSSLSKSTIISSQPTTPTTPSVLLNLLDELTYDEMKTLVFYEEFGLLDRMIYCPIIKWIMLDLNEREKYIETFFNQIQMVKICNEVYGSKILLHNIKIDNKDFLSNMLDILHEQMMLKKKLNNKMNKLLPSTSSSLSISKSSELELEQQLSLYQDQISKDKDKKMKSEEEGDEEEEEEEEEEENEIQSKIKSSELEMRKNNESIEQLDSINEENQEISQQTISSSIEKLENMKTIENNRKYNMEEILTEMELFEKEFIAICNCDKIWYSDIKNGIFLPKILEISEFESHYACTKFLKNDLLLCGGISLNEKGPCSLCKYYSTELNEWKDLPSMKETRFMHSAILYHDNVYALGGFNNQTIEIFDINKEKWIYGPSLKRREDNYDICTMILNDSIYALGGRGRSFQHLDIRNNNWIELPIALDVCMHPFSPAVAFNNLIYYLSNNKVKAFDIRINGWLDTDYTYKDGKKLSQFRVLIINNNKIILADSPLNLGTIIIDLNNVCNFSLSNFVTLSLNTNYCGLLSI